MTIHEGEAYWIIGYMPPEGGMDEDGLFYEATKCVADVSGSEIQFIPFDEESFLQTFYAGDIKRLKYGKGGKCGYGFWCIAKTKKEAEEGFGSTYAIKESIEEQTKLYEKRKSKTMYAMNTLTELLRLKIE